MIIGSTAIKHWFPDFREPKDLDVLDLNIIPVPGKIDPQWHAAASSVIAASTNQEFADPNVLFTLKVSHAHWNVHWEKTMHDIEFLKRKGCVLNFALYQELIKVWEEIHGQKRVNMNRKMNEFFSDHVPREYDHEKLHELVAFYERPMHEKLRPDQSTAWCSQEKFESLTREDQEKTALEEIMVVAIERFGLNAESNSIQTRHAMSRAYKQLVTSMTKGWFARFLILNHFELLTNRRTLWQPKLFQTLRNKLSKTPNG